MVSVDLWEVDLTNMRDVALLSGDERERAARLIAPHVRRRFINARAGLRETLGRVIDSPPESLKFGTDSHGKPYLSGIAKAPHFSVSHSEEVALIAVSNAPVGVDIEQIRPLPNIAQMAEMSFSDEERAELWSLDESARPDAFFRLWTRKEAVMKAHGAGFRLAKAFSLPVAKASRDETASHLTHIPLDGQLFAVQEIDVAAGFVAAVAVAMNSADDHLQLLHHSR